MSKRPCIVCYQVSEMDPRQAIGDCCAPARQHVVSMQTASAPARWVAVCPCGWRFETAQTRAGRVIQDMEIVVHWRKVVEEAEAANGRL